MARWDTEWVDSSGRVVEPSSGRTFEWSNLRVVESSNLRVLDSSPSRWVARRTLRAARGGAADRLKPVGLSFDVRLGVPDNARARTAGDSVVSQRDG